MNNEFVVWDAEIVSLLTIVVILFLSDIGSEENIQFVVGEEAGCDEAGKATAATSQFQDLDLLVWHVLPDKSQHLLVSFYSGIANRSSLSALIDLATQRLCMFDHVIPDAHARVVDRIDDRIVLEAVVRVVVRLRGLYLLVGSNLSRFLFLSAIHVVRCILRVIKFKLLQISQMLHDVEIILSDAANDASSHQKIQSAHCINSCIQNAY